MDAAPPITRIELRGLPLAARLTLALFLVSTGIGYLAALVQLHFQHASPGNALPTSEDAVRVFHGQRGKSVSQIERLLTADEKAGWNGSGSMAAAFTTKSADWKKHVKNYAKKLNQKDANADSKIAEAELRKERDGERLAILAWIEKGATKSDYEKDAFTLPSSFESQRITEEYVNQGDDGARVAKIKSILTDRCVRCHTTTDPEEAEAGEYPLEKYEQLKPRVTVTASSAMSLNKLAQTTHVHLLGFSMLYGLTGLILAFSSYSCFLRVILCPLPLVAQILDISFWWLARLPEPYGPQFAGLIAVSGAVVAVGLLLHIVLSLFDLFEAKGKVILFLLLGGVLGAATLVCRSGMIENYLLQEKAGVEAVSR